MDGSEHEKRHRGMFEAVGTGLTCLLVAIFAFIYALTIYQTTLWKDFFYGGTVNIGETCEVASAITPHKDFPVFSKQHFKSIQLPHHIETVLPGKIPSGQHGHAEYRCYISNSALNTTEGLFYLSLGFVYGSDTLVDINGTNRAYISSDSRVFLPLNRDDLHADPLVVTVKVTSDFDDLLGFTGQSPLVLAQGNAEIEKLFGQEVMLNETYNLHHLLPVLALSIFLILVWYKGIRSRILVSTFFYFFTTAVCYLLPIIAPILPGGIERIRSLKLVLSSLPEMALVLLACEFLGIGRKYLKYSHMVVLGLGIIEFLSVAMAKDHFAVQFQLRNIHLALFIGACATIVAYYGFRLRNTFEDTSSKKLSTYLVVILALAGVAVFIDTLSWLLLSFEPRLAAKINLFIPIAIGIVVAQNIALIQKQYQDEKHKRQKMESDLDLAKEIQDSLALPPPKTDFAGMKVSCFQIKHSQVAGDWMAVRRCGDKEMIILVADVTGKGVQAALVVHAVQSLWADALAEDTFDAEVWIAKVNRTLYRLGERRPHSATMGILSIRKDRLKYWCMGHTPLFVVIEDTDKPLVKPLISRGGILGVNPDITIDSQELSLIGLKRFHLLLGSDGVFDKGSRTRPRDVTEFLALVRQHGPDSLEGRDEDDDRTLVYVDSAA